MSIRTSGLARRSFIIGSRLWPPAMTRASGPWRSSAAIAPSTLVARSYSNGPGVCTSGPLLGRAGGPGLGAAITVSVRRGRRAGRAGRSGRLLGHHPAAGETTAHAGLLARLVALRRVGPDDRRALEALRTRLPRLGIQQPRRQAAALDVAQHPAARAGGGDRRLAAEAGERQRALRVDLADPRRAGLPALREVAEAPGAGGGGQAVDEPDGVLHARLLDEQALEQVDARVEVAVDVADDLGDRGALLDDLPDRRDRLVEADRDLPQRGDRGEQVDDEDDDDRDDRDQQDDSGGRHQSSFASSRITSSEAPWSAAVSIVRRAWSCVVRSSGTASRSVEPAAAAAPIRRTPGTIPRASVRTRCSSSTTTGATTTSRTMSPIHQRVIAASSRRPSSPSTRSPAGPRGSCRTGR